MGKELGTAFQRDSKNNYLNKIMTLEYNTKDRSIDIRIEYFSAAPLKYYPGLGKAWPRQTQCLVYINGLLRGNGTVVKHNNDKDNPKFAITAATKKAISCIKIKEIRSDIWKMIHEKLNK